MLLPDDIAAYFARIEYAGSTEPTLQTLSALHTAHLVSVPFENHDIPRGVPIVLDVDAMFDKIVRRNRGGFCYELNGVFASLLASLGYDVTLLSAGVADDAGVFGPEYDHLLLLVRLDGPYIADVGFGNGFVAPLAFRDGLEQSQGASRFRFVAIDERWQLDRSDNDGPWKPQYSFADTPRALTEFAGMCLYHQTSADSPFTRKRLATRLTESGRATLVDRKLTIDDNGEQTIRELDPEELTEDVLRERFGLIIPQHPLA